MPPSSSRWGQPAGPELSRARDSIMRCASTSRIWPHGSKPRTAGTVSTWCICCATTKPRAARALSVAISKRWNTSSCSCRRSKRVSRVWTSRSLLGGAVQIIEGRERALILLGFWRSFRVDDLCRLSIDPMQLQRGTGLEIVLRSGKNGHESHGRTLVAPVLQRLLPVQAYEAWIDTAAYGMDRSFVRLIVWGAWAIKASIPTVCRGYWVSRSRVMA